MTKPTDDLYIRYMKSFQDSTAHTADCPACQIGQDCSDGAPVHERFARLQQAYRQRQAQQHRP
ncbi:hypothetical protein [Streptomyces triculaminicus]|uniref:hypothetical protein n=1 Tax=Streptomyces triculaminicus TaxID=2816232 RepID=UPI0037CF3446